MCSERGNYCREPYAKCASRAIRRMIGPVKAACERRAGRSQLVPRMGYSPYQSNTSAHLCNTHTVPPPTSMAARSLSRRAIELLTQNIGMPAVAGRLLDHMDVDPAQ